MGIYGYVALTEEIRTDIVEAGSMVSMFMSIENAVYCKTATGKHLLPEIRPTVYYVRVSFPVNPHRYPQAFIPGVAAKAYRVRAAYNRYAL